MNVGDEKPIEVPREVPHADSFLAARSALRQAVDIMSSVSQEDLPKVLNAVGAFYDLSGGFRLGEGY